MVNDINPFLTCNSLFYFILIIRYQGHKLYNYDDPLKKINSEIEDFVQVVWKSSLNVGVGIKLLGDKHNTTIIVARYRNGTNFASASALKANVMKMKSGGKAGNSCIINLRMF